MGSLKSDIIEYCERIGKNSLLVQGAGGNISWKEGSDLWIKASGMRLANATIDEIFIPADLVYLREAIRRRDFGVTPILSIKSDLRPSIETLLHAVMPQTIVLHLHAVPVLSRLIRYDCRNEFLALMNDSIPWFIVKYCQPGAELAAAVSAAFAAQPETVVIFLESHGLVIGADSVTKIDNTLDLITDMVGISAPIPQTFAISAPKALIHGYEPIAENNLHQLALEPNLFPRLAADWALCPDHVVFLGKKAYVFQSWNDLHDSLSRQEIWPELVFIRDVGVFIRPSFSDAKMAQLRCYLDILLRQNPKTKLRKLTESQCNQLLNWDAERYRTSIAT
jgi:rhamnose utilization protein RhaD (predicted bifunctional aldolase and dehydrogenase)